MKFERFEDIIGWQKAKELTVEIYRIFGICQDYGFRNQVQRASVSIMNNIAEGYERKTNNEFKQFLYIAKGSSAEVRSMLHLGNELNIIQKQDFERLYQMSEEISKVISGLIKTL
jgi:four helix bundle protein